MTYRCDTKTIPDLTLERYLLGELPKAEMESLAKTLENDLDLQSRLSAIKTSNEKIQALYPSEKMVLQIKEQMGNVIPSPFQKFKPALALAAVLALAIAVSIWIPNREVQMLDGVAPDQLQEPTRIKGDARLFLFRKTDQGTESLTNGSVAHQGDRIQIYYHAGDQKYGAIFSIDGNGILTQHLPDLGNQSVMLTQGNPVALNFSYELDNAPKWERFYFITSQTPFDLKALQSTLKSNTDSLQRNTTLKQFVFTLQKGMKQ
jgi:hypothetical protein